MTDTDLRTQLRGLWLPLVTPFRDRELDEPSLRGLVRHYAGHHVNGLILAATSMIPELFILVGYGWLAHRAAHASARFGVSGGMNRWLSRIEGVGLLACATLVLRFNRG